MSVISTHVLDTARGKPAAGVAVTLEAAGPDGCRIRRSNLFVFFERLELTRQSNAAPGAR